MVGPRQRATFAAIVTGAIAAACVASAGGAGAGLTTPPGALDATFGEGGVVRHRIAVRSGLAAVAGTPDGSVLMLAEESNLARVGGEGALDRALALDGTLKHGLGTATAVAADGAATLLGGRSLLAGQGYVPLVRRVLADGSPDAAFGTVQLPGVSAPRTFLRVSDGRLLVALDDGRVVRVTGTGAVDGTFGSGGVAQPGAFGSFLFAARDAAEGIAVVSEGNDETPPVAVRYDAAGHRLWIVTLDRFEAVTAVAAAPGGALVVAGLTAERRPQLMRLLASGSADPAFGGELPPRVPGSPVLALSRVGALLSRSDGGLLVGAEADAGDPFDDPRALVLLRLTPAGIVDGTFGDDGAGDAPLAAWPGPARIKAILPAAGEHALVASEVGSVELLARFGDGGLYGAPPPAAAPPATSFVSAPPAEHASDTAIFVVQTDRGRVEFECSLDGAAFEECGSTGGLAGADRARLVFEVALGPHTLAVRARDRVDGSVDASPATHAWTRVVRDAADTTPPDTFFEETPPEQTGDTARFAFVGSGDGPLTFECALDGGGFAACVSPVDFSELSTGFHSLDVRARDQAGNVETSPLSVVWLAGDLGERPDVGDVTGPVVTPAPTPSPSPFPSPSPSPSPTETASPQPTATSTPTPTPTVGPGTPPLRSHDVVISWRKRVLRLRVSVPGAGWVRAGASGRRNPRAKVVAVGRASVRAPRGGTFALRIVPLRKAVRALRGQRVAVRVVVRFSPNAGTPSSVAKTIRVRFGGRR